MIASASPAYPVKKKVVLGNGSIIEVTLRGDEHFKFYRSDDGRNFRLKSANLAEQISDEEFLNLKEHASKAKQQANARRMARSRKRVGDASGGLTGTKKGLVILVNFKDTQLQDKHDKAFYQRYFNEEGFSDNGFIASVSDYFKSQSYNQFTIDFDIAGPVTLDNNMEYYGGNTSDKDGSDARPQLMAWHAMMKANSEVDYSKYDWDGDGYVDQVFIIYAGYAEAQGGEENTIWPHESSVYGQNGGSEILDKMRLSTYGCSSELMGSAGTIPDGIGTPCHEFSHCLGLPDVYDTDYSGGYGMSCWDIMSSGSYNGTEMLSGICPSAYTSFERWQAGWLEPTEINSETEVTGMKPITEAPEAYILYNDGNRDEFYMIENRQKKSFDQCQYGHGMLVVHIDYDQNLWNTNRVNDDPNHQHYNLIPADNSFRIQYAEDLAGDAFPGPGNVTALTNFTTPAATVFQANTDGTFLMNKSIENISESSDGLISFIACRPMLETPQPALAEVIDNGFTVSWPAVPDAHSYELDLTEYPSKLTPEESVIIRETFAGAMKKNDGLTDISSKLANYLDNSGFSGAKLYQNTNGLLFGTSSNPGRLTSPTKKAPATGSLTVVVRVRPYGTTTLSTVKGTVSFAMKGKTVPSIDFEFNKEGYMVFHPDAVFDTNYNVTFSPTSRMYMKEFVVYDGHFTAEELGLTDINAATVSAARHLAPHRAVTTKSYTTTNNYYQFTELEPTSRYEVQVRAVESDGRKSAWSEIINIDLSTGISDMLEAIPYINGGNTVFDLQGRRVSDTNRPGIYIRNGQKIIK